MTMAPNTTMSMPIQPAPVTYSQPMYTAPAPVSYIAPQPQYTTQEIQAPRTYMEPVTKTIQVPKTVMEDHEIEYQAPKIEMETRTIQVCVHPLMCVALQSRYGGGECKELQWRWKCVLVHPQKML